VEAAAKNTVQFAAVLPADLEAAAELTAQLRAVGDGRAQDKTVEVMLHIIDTVRRTHFAFPPSF
jgi:hypothetical protein